MEAMPGSKWLSPKAAAAHLGVSVRTVTRWIESRKLPVCRIGRNVRRFDLVALDRWLGNQK